MPEVDLIFPILNLVLLAAAGFCAWGWYRASAAYAEALEKIAVLREQLRAKRWPFEAETDAAIGQIHAELEREIHPFGRDRFK